MLTYTNINFNLNYFLQSYGKNWLQNKYNDDIDDTFGIGIKNGIEVKKKNV